MLTQLLVSKLDDSMQKDWEENALRRENPNFVHLMEFLEGQTRILDAVAVDQFFEGQSVSSSSSSSPVKRSAAMFSVNSASDKSTPKCLSCGGPHYISGCPSLEKMDLGKRFEVVNAKKLCSNCLRRYHINRDCSSYGRCRTCSKKHHSLLHPGFAASGVGSSAVTHGTGERQTNGTGASTSSAMVSTANNAVFQPTQQSSVASIYASNVATEMREAHIFLSTVLVLVKDCNGQSHTERALLDSGSQANLISERLCQLLKLPRKNTSIPISGVGNALIRVRHSVTATISSRISNYSVPVEFMVLKKVAEDQPSPTIPIGSWNIPTDMDLADPGFSKRGPIDLLLDLEYFFEFLLIANGRMQIQRVGEHLPLFVNTVFGWIAAGKADLGLLNPISSCHLSTGSSLSTLEQRIEKFWTLEELDEASRLTQEEQDCEDHFQANFSRDLEGRYVVRLPKQTFGLASSSFLAIRSLQQLAHDEGERYPRAKAALLNDFYVDDFIGGAESVREALLL